MGSARAAIRVAGAVLRVLLRAVSGKVLVGLFESRENDVGPYEMWTAAAQACGVENLVGKRPTFLSRGVSKVRGRP